MTEDKAEQAGYEFTGHYSWDKEEMKRAAAELRKEGNKAMVVYSPASPYTRSCTGGGYSVYWIESEANIAIREAKEKQRNLAFAYKERDELRGKLAQIEAKIADSEDNDNGSN